MDGKQGAEARRLFCDLFPPWEFYPLNEHPEFKMPFIIRNHSGKGMEERLDLLIRNFKEKKANFLTYSGICENETDRTN